MKKIEEQRRILIDPTHPEHLQLKESLQSAIARWEIALPFIEASNSAIENADTEAEELIELMDHITISQIEICLLLRCSQ